jgi:hypothetical protein
MLFKYHKSSGYYSLDALNQYSTSGKNFVDQVEATEPHTFV